MTTARIDPIYAADMVLNACGRPVPPPGYSYVDLPYVTSFHSSVYATAPPVTPAQGRIANNTKAMFLCRGVMIQSPLSVRIKWPSGRYLQQGPTWSGLAQPGNPIGTGGNMIALDNDVPVDRGAKITVEMSGNVAGLVDVQFWGVLRYLLMIGPESGKDLPRLVPDPVGELRNRPRYRCGPPQNIMAPEWLLGNQCTPETPDGFEDESYTFFSNPIVVPVGGRVANFPIIVPGADDVVVKRWRVLSRYSIDGGSAIPVFAMRLPSGYSVTGGDMVPTPNLFWIPAFPTFRLHAGDRIIVDMADILGTGEGSVSNVFEFDAVKRKKVAK